MLRKVKEQRTHKSNLLLAGSTAIAAGAVNVASVIAFFAFSSNVTGHVAIFAEEIMKGHWHQVLVVLLWLFMFMFGAFLANFLIKQNEHRGAYFAHSIPVVIEVVALLGISMYGFFMYSETLLETELMVATLLFSMGVQNSLVATISGGVVKTTHLTGLFTDLGMSISIWMHPKTKRTLALRRKLQLHLVILSFYLGGGLVGGFLFLQWGFLAFFFAASVMVFVLWYDLSWVMAYKFAKLYNIRFLMQWFAQEEETKVVVKSNPKEK